MVRSIPLLWGASVAHLLLIAMQWKLAGRLAGLYSAYLWLVASTYWIGMTLRHFEAGSLFVRHHLPDLGFVVWQSLTVLTFISSYMSMSYAPGRMPWQEARRRFFRKSIFILLGAWFVVGAVTMFNEIISSFDPIDAVAYGVGVALAALPLPWLWRRTQRGA